MSSSPQTDAPARLRHWYSAFVPRALTGRLVLTSIALVALSSILVTAVATFALRSYLYGRLDDQLRDAADRTEHASIGVIPGGPGVEIRGPLGLGPGSLFGELGSTESEPRIIGDDYEAGFERLTATAIAQLNNVSSDATPTTVDLNGAGRYRVVVEVIDGHTFVTGLPTASADDAITRMFRLEALIAIAVVVSAGLCALVLIRRQLAPLRAVAATAREVSQLPLESGDVEVSARVPAEIADPMTEVGQVGDAFNVMLDRVSEAFKARHLSEERVRQFVADASHELRTPLATIKGYAELSRRSDPADPTTMLHALNRVETETERMSALVDDLLLLARLDSGRPLESTEVDVSMLVVETVSDARVVAPEHQWRIELPDEPLVVMGDPHRLHQVLSNLVRNAARHTQTGSVVTISARQVVGAVELAVHDNGQGLPPQLADNVFERFARGDSSRTRESGGAGLGLAIVDAIVTAHGGTVSVMSEPGDTTFVVRLPMSHSHATD